MKILLINPPAPTIEHQDTVIEPLGLLYIAGILQANHYDVLIIDCNAEQMTFQDLYHHLKCSSAIYDIIGLTGMTPLKNQIYQTARVVRKFCKYLLLGGAHASSYKKDVFKDCALFDAIVDGEGERVIVEICSKIQNTESFQDVFGVITKEKTNARPELIQNLDELPFPPRNLLPYKKYKYVLAKHSNTASLFTSRGCPYRCVFCEKNVFGSKWRARSPENIVQEIEEIIAKYKIRSFIIYDDLFTVNKKRVLKFCKLILQKKLQIDWKCEGRVNLADYNLMRLMRSAGCSTIAYGIETFNQVGLDFLRKEVKANQIYRAIELTKKAGIQITGYFILGIPTETFAQELFSINEALRMKIDYPQFCVLTPHENTQLYAIGKEKGWLKEGDFVNPLEHSESRRVLLSDKWTEEKIQLILRLSFQKFMLNPRFLLLQLSHIKSLSNLMNLGLLGINYFRWLIKKIIKKIKI